MSAPGLVTDPLVSRPIPRRTDTPPASQIGRLFHLSSLRGVYAVRVAGLGEGERDAVANLGTRPTVDGRVVVLEVHVFDWSGDAYGRCVDVSFLAKIRDERKFDTFDALKVQIGLDSARAREILGRPA